MDALGPKMLPGLVKVPSPGAIDPRTSLLANMLDLDLSSSSGMVSFPFKSPIVLPFLLDEVLETSS